MLLAGPLLLGGCDRDTLPHWLGGRAPQGVIVEGPLAAPMHPSLDPLRTLGRNGMRVSIAPSFGDYGFVIDFIPQPFDCYLATGRSFDEERHRREGCWMIAVRYTTFGGDEAPEPRIRRFNFHVPEEEYREVVADFDRLARRWRGSDSAILDGTGVGVEQFREGRLRSIDSNVPTMIEPDNPAANMRLHAHRLLLAYGPAGAVPRNSHFTVGRREFEELPCMAQSFDEPDPDGFGAGQDACARELARPPRQR